MDATPLSGAYAVPHGAVAVSLTLEQTPGGTVRGRLTGLGGAFDLHGLREEATVQGTLVDAAIGRRLSFLAQLQGERFLLSLFPLDAGGQIDFNAVETLTFERSEAPPAGASPPVAKPAPRPQPTALPSEPPTTTERPATAEWKVVVNGQRLSAAQLRSLQRTPGSALADGRYWYDATSGAWGAVGGPLAGFLAPGLDLPGPMPADASGGGTGRFANGRELHPQEVRALAQCLGAAPPGRYWLDALGNLGLEGGPFLLNLLAAARPAGGTAGAGSLPGLENPLKRTNRAPVPSPAVTPAAVSRDGPTEPGTARPSPSYPRWTTLDDPFTFA
jgi:hypothetical protein